MKKTLAVLLTLVLLVSALSGCGGNSKDANNDTSNIKTGNTDYEYSFRDLAEEKYITPASEFAGGDGTEGNPYQISNAAELAVLHEKMATEQEELKREFENLVKQTGFKM